MLLAGVGELLQYMQCNEVDEGKRGRSVAAAAAAR